MDVSDADQNVEIKYTLYIHIYFLNDEIKLSACIPKALIGFKTPKFKNNRQILITLLS